MAINDLTGKKFGRWTVIKLHHKKQLFNKEGIRKRYLYYWLCKCDCGTERAVLGNSLTTGQTKSCGCLKRERVKEVRTKHGLSGTKLKGIYNSMKERCYNKNDKNYLDYGGRGIKVCQEWQDDFMNFYNWAMANGYKEGLTIDRIDNDKGYSPNNCRWATMKEQCRHRRNSHLIEYNGKIQCISAWAEEYNLKDKLLHDRLKAKWDIEKALTTPVRQSKKR